MGIRYFDSPYLHQIMFCLCGLGAAFGVFLSKRFRKMKESPVSGGIMKHSMKLPDSIGGIGKGDMESLI